MNTLNFKIKSLDESVSSPDTPKVYTAIAWDGGVVDRSGEQFDASTFDLAALERQGSLPILLNHDVNQICGALVRAYLDGNQLMIDFVLAGDLGTQAAELIAAGALTAVSVGFLVRTAADGSTTRELIETSLVAVPANQNAVITSKNHELKGEIMTQATELGAPAIVRNKATQENYSVGRFILGLADPIAAKNAGYEFELSREAAKLSGKSADTPIIPWGALVKTKAQNTLTAPDSVGVDLGQSLGLPMTDASMFTTTTGALFKQTLADRLGVRTYVAPTTSEVRIPRIVRSLKPQYIARDTALPLSDAGFDTVTATPHTVGGLTTIARSALIDTNPAMQSIVMDELRKALNDIIDSTIINKIALPNAPKGIRQILSGTDQDVGAIASGADLFEMIRTLSAKDESGKLAMLSGQGFFNWGMQQPVSASLNQVALFNASGLHGYEWVKAVSSAKLDVDAAGDLLDVVDVILGNFEYSWLTMFGAGLEVAANPYGQNDWAAGAVTCRVIADTDFLVTDSTRFAMGQVTI
jgi:HK97 family phage prohead protease